MNQSDTSNDSLRFIKIILLTIVIGAIFVELANLVSGAESLSNFFFTVGIILLGSGLVVGVLYIALKVSANRNKKAKVNDDETSDPEIENDEMAKKEKKNN